MEKKSGVEATPTPKPQDSSEDLRLTSPPSFTSSSLTYSPFRDRLDDTEGSDSPDDRETPDHFFDVLHVGGGD